MKSLSLLALVGLGTLILAGCDPIDGQLKVTKSFSGVQSWLFGTNSVAIPVGTYSASLDFSSETSATLEIQAQSGEIDLDLAIPQNATASQYDGPISLSSKQSGQPFDVKGTISTNESDTGVTNDVETCSRTETYSDCDDKGCHEGTREISGQQQVSYHYHDSYAKLALKVYTPGTTKLLATFTGDRDDNNKVYDSKGVCY